MDEPVRTKFHVEADVLNWSEAIAIIGGTQASTDEDVADAGNLTVMSIGAATHGAAAVSADHKGVTFTASDGCTGGADRFTYTLGDGRGGSVTATVTVGIGAVAKAQSLNHTANRVTVNFKGVPALPFTVEQAEDVCFTVNMTSLGSLTAVMGWRRSRSLALSRHSSTSRQSRGPIGPSDCRGQAQAPVSHSTALHITKPPWENRLVKSAACPYDPARSRLRRA